MSDAGLGLDLTHFMLGWTQFKTNITITWKLIKRLPLKIKDWLPSMRELFQINNPFGNYMFKITMGTLEQGVKYV